MSKFWDGLSCSVTAFLALCFALGLISMYGGCDVRATPNPGDEVFCIGEDPETGTGRTWCCREFATNIEHDCWYE